MPFDEELARRLRDHLGGEPGLSEKKMFGGVGFLINGNLAVAASSRGGLLLRIDPGLADGLITAPEAEPFEMGGRSMRGWLAIDASGVTGEEELSRWVDHGVAYARSLPPK